MQSASNCECVAEGWLVSMRGSLASMTATSAVVKPCGCSAVHRPSAQATRLPGAPHSLPADVDLCRAPRSSCPLCTQPRFICTVVRGAFLGGARFACLVLFCLAHRCALVRAAGLLEDTYPAKYGFFLQGRRRVFDSDAQLKLRSASCTLRVRGAVPLVTYSCAQARHAVHSVTQHYTAETVTGRFSVCFESVLKETGV